MNRTEPEVRTEAAAVPGGDQAAKPPVDLAVLSATLRQAHQTVTRSFHRLTMLNEVILSQLKVSMDGWDDEEKLGADMMTNLESLKDSLAVETDQAIESVGEAYLQVRKIAPATA